MSLECSECEMDLRGGHDEGCSRHPNNRVAKAPADESKVERRVLMSGRLPLLAPVHTTVVEVPEGFRYIAIEKTDDRLEVVAMRVKE